MLFLNYWCYASWVGLRLDHVLNFERGEKPTIPLTFSSKISFISLLIPGYPTSTYTVALIMFSSFRASSGYKLFIFMKLPLQYILRLCFNLYVPIHLTKGQNHLLFLHLPESPLASLRNGCLGFYKVNSSLQYLIEIHLNPTSHMGISRNNLCCKNIFSIKNIEHPTKWKPPFH